MRALWRHLKNLEPGHLVKPSDRASYGQAETQLDVSSDFFSNRQNDMVEPSTAKWYYSSRGTNWLNVNSTCTRFSHQPQTWLTSDRPNVFGFTAQFSQQKLTGAPTKISVPIWRHINFLKWAWHSDAIHFPQRRPGTGRAFTWLRETGSEMCIVKWQWN